MKDMYIKIFISGQGELYYEISEEQWEVIKFLEGINAIKEGININEISIECLC